jgi:hypothetical protein
VYKIVALALLTAPFVVIAAVVMLLIVTVGGKTARS